MLGEGVMAGTTTFLEPAYVSGERNQLRFLDFPFSVLTPKDVIALLAQRKHTIPFAYVVTPNVDHVVRAHRATANLLDLYDGAWLSICDSRVLAMLASLAGIKLPVMPGSDLAAILLDRVIGPGDKITIIGCSIETIRALQARYPLLDLAHHNPPMGFIRDPKAVDNALEFMKSHPARFVFLAVGSPQQEILAQRAACTEGMTGIGFCIGNAINFAAQPTSRAPYWMRRACLEWLHRFYSDPRRLWRRYLLDNPYIFVLCLTAAVNSAQKGLRLGKKPTYGTR
jgi:N-acetylglucosaminyldiphosphoundecaprenol N-acetyl-beta-D-mannosaminyltransferase